ncbi:MAG: RNA methyltransferase [Patescibacteria group bacterium]
MTVDARREKIERVVQNRQRGVVVVLEDIHDPHNVAAILRTCDAFGFQQIVCVYEKEEYVNPKRVGKSSSSSANKWLDFTIYRSSAECASALKKAGYRLFVTMLDATAQSLYDTDMTTEPIALVFGNEHRGVSDVMCQASDVKLYIPMRGMVQSLNVSVTAAICLSELSRQRGASKKDYSLPKKEREKLAEDFLKR